MTVISRYGLVLLLFLTLVVPSPASSRRQREAPVQLELLLGASPGSLPGFSKGQVRPEASGCLEDLLSPWTRHLLSPINDVSAASGGAGAGGTHPLPSQQRPRRVSKGTRVLNEVGRGGKSPRDPAPRTGVGWDRGAWSPEGERCVCGGDSDRFLTGVTPLAAGAMP